jgi:hypothetical protein
MLYFKGQSSIKIKKNIVLMLIFLVNADIFDKYNLIRLELLG